MKRIFLLLFGFVAALFVGSCTLPSLPCQQEQPLKLSIQLEQESIESFDQFHGELTLKNVGKENLLVNGRLAFVPVAWPSQFIEGVTLITNPSGDIVAPNGKIDIDFPNVDMFVDLKPGQEIRKLITLRGIGYSSDLFVRGEKYTLVVIYQNEMDVQQELDGKIVRSWVGSIKSSPLTFEFTR